MNDEETQAPVLSMEEARNTYFPRDTGPSRNTFYSWAKQVGGVGAFVAVGMNSPTLDSSNFAETDVIRCTVTPSDGEGEGSPVAATCTISP